MTPFELTDGVVLLAAPTIEDVDRMTALCQDADVVRWTTVPHPYDRSDAEHFLTSVVDPAWDAGSAATWAIREPTTRTLHGMVEVGHNGDSEIVFWLEPAVRARGWMTRAARLACRAAFEAEVDHVRWKAIVGNEASRRVALRVGFQLDGGVRRLVEQRGEWRDGWIGTLLPNELQ